MSSIRDAVPFDLAQWLDAHSIEGDQDFGRPGFPQLRAAWVGRAPAKDALEALDEWLAEQRKHQEKAEVAYQRLFELEPVIRIENDSISIPGWFAAWWGQVLTSQPWDESLGKAVDEALDYIKSLPAASVEESIEGPAQKNAEHN